MGLRSLGCLGCRVRGATGPHQGFGDEGLGVSSGVGFGFLELTVLGSRTWAFCSETREGCSPNFHAWVLDFTTVSTLTLQTRSRQTTNPISPKL